MSRPQQYAAGAIGSFENETLVAKGLRLLPGLRDPNLQSGQYKMLTVGPIPGQQAPSAVLVAAGPQWLIYGGNGTDFPNSTYIAMTQLTTLGGLQTTFGFIDGAAQSGFTGGSIYVVQGGLDGTVKTLAPVTSGDHDLGYTHDTAGSRAYWRNLYLTGDVYINGAVMTRAPVDADYLVGTANGTLTNEIAVGTTPGGELGGTWASPTVDAQHAGSYHTQPKAQSADDANDGTTLLDSDTFTWAMGANEVLVINGMDIAFLGSGASVLNSEGVKWDWNGPTGFGGSYIYTTSYISGGVSSVFTTQVGTPGTDQTISAGTIDAGQSFAGLRISGRFTTGANAGTLAFRFCKQTDTGSSTVAVAAGSTAIGVRV